MQQYGIKCVSDLRHAGLWFSLGTPISSTNKADLDHITEILLKVELNTITLTPSHRHLNYWAFQSFVYEHT
jgi:hypothetical protein